MIADGVNAEIYAMVVLLLLNIPEGGPWPSLYVAKLLSRPISRPIIQRILTKLGLIQVMPTASHS